MAKVLQGSSSFSEVLMVLEASARASAGLEGLVNFSEVLSGYLKSTVLYGYLSVSGFTRVFHDIGDVSTVPYRTFAKKREPWRT